ncbi:hypothetical protein KV580_19425 [Pseudomonas chlororaphis]|nr:hypothetical protein [Pseudomonas chlororaphis]
MNSPDVAVSIDAPAGPVTSPFTISGKATPNAKVMVYRSGAGKRYDNDALYADAYGNWSITNVTEDIGAYPIVAFQIAYGQQSDWTAEQNYTVKVSAPLINAPAGPLTSPFTISGKATPNAKVMVYRSGAGKRYDNDALYADAYGNWSITNVTEEVGTYPIVAFQIAHGQQSDWTAEQNYTVNTVQVSPPLIDAPAGPLTSPFTISGKATPNAKVMVYRSGAGKRYDNDALYADAYGNWSIANVTEDIGTYPIVAFQIAHGQQSDWTAEQNYTVKVSAPLIDAPTGPLTSPFTISGKAVPGAKVMVYKSGAGKRYDNDALYADAYGNWSITNVTEDIGTYPIVAFQIAYGQQSDWTAEQNYTVKVSAPLIDAPAGPLTSPFTISGKAIPGAKVMVYKSGAGKRYDNDALYADAYGNWSITNVTEDIGTYPIVAYQTAYGQDSAWTAAQDYTVKVPPPLIDAPAGPLTSPFTISGKAIPNAKVMVYKSGGEKRYDNDQLYADAYGNWSITNVMEDIGTYPIVAYQLAHGQESAWTAEQNYTINTVQASPPLIDTPAGPVTSPFTISGKAVPGAKVMVYRSGAGKRYDNDALYADAYGNWSITNVTEEVGTYPIVAFQIAHGQQSDWTAEQNYIVQSGPGIDYDSFLKNETFNTTSKKENYVDPRTGLFNAYFPIVSLAANAAQGPNLDIDFFYRPYSFNTMGIGAGWKIRLSSYDLIHRTLTLSTGVSIDNPNGMDPREILRRYGFTIGADNEYDAYGQPKKAIQIYHKDGSIEKLNFGGASDELLPSEITTPHGFTLYIDWENQQTNKGYMSRIVSIRDEKSLLLSATYHENNATFILWPNTQEQYSVALNFDTTSNTLSSVTFPDSSTPSNQNFYYELNPTLGPILTAVTGSSGLRESVIYNSSGVTANNITLPWVTQHTVTPGGGQPEIITSYNYTRTSSDSYTTTLTNHATEQIITKIFNFEKNRLTSEIQNINECSATMTYEYLGAAPYLNKTLYENKNSGASRQGPTKQSLFSPDGNIIYSDTNGVPTRWTYASAGTPSTSQRFNLPVTLEYPVTYGEYNDSTSSDARQYSNTLLNASERHIESEQYYSLSGTSNDPDLVRKFYSYTRLPEKPPSLAAGNLRPSLCLTIYSPDSVGGSSLGKWKEGSMILEKIEYIKDTASPHHGRIQSTSTEILDASGNTVPYSKYITYFSYELTDTYLKKTTEVVSSEGISNTTEETTSIFSGRVIKLTDTLKNTTEYTYDSLGRTLKKTQNSQSDQYHKTTDYQYIQAPTGPSVVITNDTGVKQWIKSDALQRPISTEIWTDITGSSQWLTVTSTQYDALGREEKTFIYDYLANGSTLSSLTETHYDNWGNPSKSVVNNEKTIYSNYDPISNTLENWIEFGGTPCGKTLTTYNSQGEITLITNADVSGNMQASQSYQYDGFQRLTTQTHKTRSLSISLDTTYIYDNFGRPSTVTSDNKTITYSYPSHTSEKVVSEISVLDRSTFSSYSLGQQNYDSLNRLIRSASGGRTYTFTYATSSSSATTATVPDAREVSFEYQAELNNQLIKQSVASSGQQQAYTYQTPGSLFETASRTPGTVVNRAYNANGLLLTEKLSNLNNESDRSSTYQYSLNGLLTSETDFFGNETTYHYNQNGRYIGSSSPTITVQLSHDNSGLLIKEDVYDAGSGTAMTITYTYDENHRETSRVFSAAGFPTLKIAYNYHSDWLISDITFSRDNTLIRQEVFTYFPSGQLQACSYYGTEYPVDPWGNALTAQSFTYDFLDNILTCTSQFGAATNITSYHYDNPYDKTQLSSITNTHPTYPNQIVLEYDSAGRVTKDETGRTLSYDSLGQLKEVFSADQGIAMTYTYDAYNRIAGTKSALRTQNLFYKGSSVFAQSESIFSVGQGKTQAVTNSQLNSSNACCTQVKSVLDYTTGATQATHFMELKDPHGSLIASYDTTNKTASYFSYTAHGYRPLNNNDHSFLGFNGEPIDLATGLYHLGNGYRAYNPITLRFHLPDSQSPFGEGGINSYSYCSDPINYSDPTGHAGYRINPRNSYTSSINHGSLISTILWGGVAIMAAIPTGGTSLLLGGALLGTEIAATSFGIASALTERSNPKLSEQLGWASLGLGLSSIAYGSFRAGKTIYSAASDFRRAASLSTEHLGQAKKITQTMGGPIEKIKLHEGNLTLTQESFKGGKRLTFNAHGAIPPGEESALMRVGENFIGPAEAIDLARNLGYDIKNYDYVRLIMCHSADGGNASFAQTLSTLTRKPVKAFIGKIDVSWVADEVGKHSNRQERLAMYIGKKYEIVTPTHKKIIGFNEQGSFAFGNTDEYNSIRVNFFPR